MKKFFGIIFLLIGLAMIGLGVAALVDANSRGNSFEGQIGNTFSEHYRQNNEEQQMAGAGLLGGGVIFFIIGIIMIVTKTKAQRKKETELEVLKKVQVSNNTSSQPDNSTKSMDDKVAQLEKLGKFKEQGLLTEEEFQHQKKKIID